MIVLTKENNSMKLAVSGFVSSESVENIAENEFMKITIDPSFKVFRFADVNYIPVFIIIKIAAGLSRYELNSFQ